MADPTKQLAIVGITLSVDFGDKNYGNGVGSFMNLQAKSSSPDGVPLEDLDKIVSDGLDMYFAAWQTLLGSRFAAGIIDAATFKDTLQKTTLRMEMVRKYLRKGVTEA